MTFILKQDANYIEDLSRLPKDIQEDQINITHRQLQENPRQSGLRSHQFQAFKKQRVFRSDVTDNFRIAWFYGEGDQSIILWHVSSHSEIDSLENLKSFPQINIGKIIGVPTVSNAQSTPHPPAQSWISRPASIFQRISTTHLRLFGVSEKLIERVRAIENIDAIYSIGLPNHTVQILLGIYTDPDWTPDKLVDPCCILYRANADQLEDYCKGKIRKLMLDLSPDQEKIVQTEAHGVLLVKGVAGSGKSTVGIYRALYLAKNRDFFATKPVLFLTYNEMLAQVVNQLFKELTPRSELVTLMDRIKSITLRNMAQEILIDNERVYDQKKSESQLNSSIATLLPKSLDYEFLKQENSIHTEIAQVIKGRGIKTWEEYKSIKRIGRGQPLQEKMRKIIWDIYCEYQVRLSDKKFFDEADLYLEALKSIRSQQGFEPYPEVVVDEAQDLPPVALELAAALAGGGKSFGLCLLADPSQSIYYQGISWKDGNVQIHSSRVKTLQKNFRNTKQILNAAWALAKGDTQQALGEVIQPETASRIGPKPRLYETSPLSQQDLKLLKELILKYSEENRYRLNDIAILCRTKDKVDEVNNYLKHAKIPVCHYRESSFDVFENNIKVITINSAKGLEFPVVILMEIDDGVLPRNIEHIQDHEDYDAKMRIERQLLYVGMTRAAEELCILFTSGKKSRFLKDIPEELFDYHGPGK